MTYFIVNGRRVAGRGPLQVLTTNTESICLLFTGQVVEETVEDRKDEAE